MQYSNASRSMVCNESGKTTEAKLLHPENAPSPMVCNASGKATAAKLLHPSNALSSMVCSASGKATEAKLMQYSNAFHSDGLQRIRQGHRDQTTAPLGMHTLRWSATHPERPPRPNYCTLECTVSDGLQRIRKGHRGQTTAPKNAHCPMVCNASGKATEAKLLHP